MSMILDALSRAEQERRSENGVGLDPSRYVGSSSIKENRLKKWILLALLVNILLVTVVLVSYLWRGQTSSNDQVSVENTSEVQKIVVQPLAEVSAQTVYNTSGLVQDVISEPRSNINPLASTQPVSIEDSGLTLQEEARVARQKVARKNTIKNVVKKTPPVRYATQPLSKPVNNAAISAPVLSPTSNYNSGDFVAVADLPPVDRSQLSQYVVNVHVYDSNVKNRFVLINMTKYREGDQLPGGGPLISAITPEGVVVDYGSGKALLERN